MATVAVLGVLEVIARPHLDHVHGADDEHARAGGDELVGQEVAAVVERALVVLVQGDHRRVRAPPA